MNSNNELSSFKWFHHQNVTKKMYQNESSLMMNSQRLPYFSPMQLLTSASLLNYFRDGDFYVREINRLDSNNANANAHTLNSKITNANDQQLGKLKLNTLNSSHSLPDLSNKISKK